LSEDGCHLRALPQILDWDWTKQLSAEVVARRRTATSRSPGAGHGGPARRRAHRAAARLGVNPDVIDELLDGVSLVLPSSSTFDVAGRLAPVELRSLDAIHVAAAGELGPDLEGVVTYDQRVIAGANAAGFPVIRP
jgi:predicted nucleic acid-binding protein